MPHTPKTKLSNRRKIIERALKDEGFRKQLIANPKAVVEKEFNVNLPADLEVQVLEQDAKKIYLVLPAKRMEELSEEELRAVSGGTGEPACYCLI